jgi:N-dimethylarginine dimethylaminohydrolase
MPATSTQSSVDDPDVGPATRIGCFSEYGTLRAVVVGSVDGLAYPAWSPNVRYLSGSIRDLLVDAREPEVDIRKQAPGAWEALRGQIEEIVATFERHNVQVLRPRPFEPLELGYLGELQGGHSLLYPADPIYVLGRHVIETCIRRPFRRKEAWPTRDVLMPFIDADPEVQHVAIPRAHLGPAGNEGPGPFLEGGDIIILGNEVLCGNTDLTSNRAGSDWLARYLSPFGYRVHPVPVYGTWLHLLGVLALLREGLAIAHLPALGGRLPKPISSWDVIEVSEQEARMLATVGMSLSPSLHIIDRRLERVIGELERRGIEPVPVDVDVLSQWGGAVRCVALPIARDPA